MKSSDHSDDQPSLKLKLLTELGTEMVELSPEADLFEHVGQRLLELSGAFVVIINEIDDATSILEIQRVLGLGSLRPQVVSLLGAAPEGMTFQLSDEDRLRLARQIRLRWRRDIHEVSFGLLDQELSHQLDQALSLTSAWGISFTRRGTVLGSANLLMKEDKEPPIDLIEAFAQQVSAALVRRQTERQQQSLLEQLQLSQRLESVGRLAGGVAHEFNNLLTAIDCNASMALSTLTPETPLESMLLDIQEAARRGTQLTMKMLTFSQRHLASPRLVDLSALLRSLETVLVTMLGATIELTLHNAPAHTMVRIDQMQLEQALLNLAFNARDAMPDGGELTIETSTVTLEGFPEGVISRPELDSSHSTSRWVVIHVTDTGSGIDELNRRQIFEPFFTTKPIAEFSGLGLSVVYGIIQQQDGQITVESTPDQGTTMSLYLPAAEPHCSTTKIAPPTSTSAHTILMVEDDPLVHRMNHRLLLQMGHTVLTATNGREGLERADAHEGEIDLLFTDVVMPELTGFELAERLQQRRPELKVLFTTGYAEHALLPEGLTAQNMELLPKPFTSEQLSRRIAAALAEG